MVDPSQRTGRTRRIAILAPMPSELAPLVRTLALRKVRYDNTMLRAGKVGDTEILASTSGMGTENAATAATRILDLTDADHVMVVGIAGGIGATRVGDLILPSVVVDHESGTEYRPAPLDDTEGQGRLVTSDDFLIEPELVAELEAAGVVALDMETSAVAAVCEARGRPWSVVRVISDRADDHPDDSVLGMVNPDGSPNLRAAARYVATHPQRIPQLARLARDSMAAAKTAAATAARTLATAKRT